MIATQCLKPEELDQVLSAPAADPRRVHARSCPRCGALLAQYASFVAAESGIPERQVADAETRIGAALDREIGLGAAPKPAAVRTRTRWAWLREPAFRPALAFAAVAIVLGIAIWSPIRLGSPGDGRLRGTEGTLAPLVRTEVEADGTLRLDWHSWSGADAYEVRFYSSDLAELGRRGPFTDTTARIGRHQIPEVVGHRELLVRVIALREGDPVGQSSVVPLPSR